MLSKSSTEDLTDGDHHDTGPDRATRRHVDRPELVIESLLLATILLAIPNGLDPEGGGRDGLFRRVAILGGLAVGLSFVAAPGISGGLLAAPWAAITAGAALRRLPGFAVAVRRGRGVRERIRTDAPFAFLAIGGLVLLTSRLGLRPLGFGEPIILLTAVHFHVAGFVLTLTATRLVRGVPSPGSAAGRAGALAVVGLLVGIPTTAIGFLGVPMLSFGGGWLVAGSGFLVGLGLIARARDRHGPGRAIAAASGAALLISMPLAAAWATTAFLAIPFLPIPVMAAVHGGLNVVGFAIPVMWLDRVAT